MLYKIYKLLCVMCIVGSLVIVITRPYGLTCRCLGIVCVMIYSKRAINQRDRLVAIQYVGNRQCRVVFKDGRIEWCMVLGSSVLTDWFVVLKLEAPQKLKLVYVALPGHPLWEGVVSVLRQLRLTQ